MMTKTKDQQAQEYVLNRQTARHNAETKEEATMADFDKTRKVWDAYDMEQAFEDGANFALGKQENDADTVIQGWVARDDDGQLLYLYGSMPTRGINMWNGHGSLLTPLQHRPIPRPHMGIRAAGSRNNHQKKEEIEGNNHVKLD